MSWRDNLLDAALDGVPFLYEEVGKRVGRRGEIHEFAGRDDPNPEDTGRAARQWTIRAFVIGEDYARVRDELERLIEAGGVHIFTDPYRGDVPVKIIGYVPITERVDQGRYATFEIPFVEAGDPLPLVVVSSASQMQAIKRQALEKVASKTRFSVAGAIAPVQDSVADGVNAAASVVRKANGKISAALNLVDNVTAAIDSVVYEIDTLQRTPSALLTKMGALFDSTMTLIAEFVPPATGIGVRAERVDLVSVAMGSLRDFMAFETQAAVIPTPTEQSELEHAAHEQLQASMRAAALASAVAVLVDLELDSAAQAQTIGDELAGYFDGVLAADLDADVHEVFSAMKAAAIEHFTEVARRLPAVTSMTPAATIPALVLAYDLYGDPDLEDDVIRRNGIRHPLFVPGGAELEVLAHE